MARRGKGEGNIRKRKDGRWEARIAVGVTDTGNTRTRSVYGPTRDSVAKQLNALLNKFSAGKLAERAPKLLIGEYLQHFPYLWSPFPQTWRAMRVETDSVSRVERTTERKRGWERNSGNAVDQWLEHRTDIQTNTRMNYQNIIRTYIKPTFAGYKLKALTPVMIEAWHKALAQPTQIKVTRLGKTTPHERKLGPRTIELAHTAFKAALAQAVRWRLLEVSPFDGVRRPPRSKAPRPVWTRSEAAKFLETVRDHPLEALYLIVILTGRRRGEILGLRWQDVDWRLGTLSINQSLIFINGRRTLKHGVKTETSLRKFTAPLEVIAALRTREGDQMLERAAAGDKWQEQGLIFTTSTGEGMYESVLRKIHDGLIARAGVPRLTLHPLRRTYTSFAILSGADIKEVSRRLGHASVEITLDIYQQLYPEQDRRAALSRAELLGLDGSKNAAGVKDGSNMKTAQPLEL